MEPRIPRGALAMVRACHGRDLKPGDVACFQSRGVLMIHHLVARIDTVAGARFVHEGETGAPGVVAEVDLVGRVVGIVPEAGGPLRAVEGGRAWPGTAVRALRFGAWLHRIGLPATLCWSWVRYGFGGLWREPTAKSARRRRARSCDRR